MSTSVDGFGLLRAMGQHPDLFSAYRSEAKKAALALLKKKLKAKSTDLSEFRALWAAISSEQMAYVLDELNDKELGSLTKKFDRHYPGQADANGKQFRNHLRALATNQAEPAPKVVTTRQAASRPAKPKQSSGLPKSMSAKPSRRRAS